MLQSVHHLNITLLYSQKPHGIPPNTHSNGPSFRSQPPKSNNRPSRLHFTHHSNQNRQSSVSRLLMHISILTNQFNSPIAQGVILVLRSIKRLPRTPPSRTTPSPPPPLKTKQFSLHHGTAPKRQPLTRPPPKPALPLITIQCSRLNKRPRDVEAGWTTWLLGTCRRIKRRTA